MKLNKLEFLLMNNPVRAIVQEKYEIKILRDMTTINNIRTALEIGCGNGHGTKLIKKYFSPKQIYAIDLDERMLEIAQRKNIDSSIQYQVMDACKLDFPDNSFDVIFDFGIIHHIPNWRDCILEMKRVLKSNGEIILEEVSSDTFTTVSGRIWKALLAHPYDRMFSTTEFVNGLTSAGFQLQGFCESYPFRILKLFSLVARKLNST